jgi:hypothetical protein
MEDSPGTLAVLQKTSLVNRDGKAHQLSEQAAALLSEMGIESESSLNSEAILILMLLLEGITSNTISGDVIALSVYHAQDRCEELGISEEVFKTTVTKFTKFSEIRKRNPLAF